MSEDLGYSSEGTNPDESLDYPVTSLPEDFFSESFSNEFDLFRKYLKAIKKNRYILTLIDEVNKERPVCGVGLWTRENALNLETNEPLPKIMWGTDASLPSASKKVEQRYSRTKGNHIIAKSVINEGEVLLLEKAPLFINVPNCSCLKATTFRCHYCAKIIFRFVPCKKCDICLFCNDDCRLAAWNEYHRWECYGLQRHFWVNDVSYAALRTLLFGINTEDYLLGVPNVGENCVSSYRYIYNFESNISKKNVRELNTILHQSARTLVYLVEKTNFFPWFVQSYQPNFKKVYNLYVYFGGLLVHHACQAVCNAVEVPIKNFFASIGYERVESVATVMCHGVALLNHSCTPNAVVIPNNDTLIVKAQTVIEKDEEITISYYPITQKMGFFERNLHCNKKHFSCQCTLCQNPTEIVYSCLKCRNKAFRHAQVVCCNKCGYKSPFSEVQAYLHQLEMSMDKFIQTKKLHHLILAFNLHKKMFGEDKISVYNHLFLSCADEFNRKGNIADVCKKVLEAIKIAEDTFKTPFEIGCRIYPLLEGISLHAYFSKDSATKSNISPLISKLAAKLEMVIKTFEIYYPPSKLKFLRDVLEKFKKYIK